MGSRTLLENKRVVLFDSDCLLCNRTIQFLLKIDKKNELTFAALSSNFGKSVISNLEQKTDSVVFYNRGQVSTKSEAFIKIGVQLGFPFNLIALVYIVPTFIRDWIYDIIARNRLHWFGKNSQCLIPSEELSGRIIY